MELEEIWLEQAAREIFYSREGGTEWNGSTIYFVIRLKAFKDANHTLSRELRGQVLY
jgi:hypothetical protein